MGTTAADHDRISAWLPEQDRIRLAVLGKLAEEASELAARASRCIVQGLDGIDPASGHTNHAELANEIADVQACIDTAREVLETRPSSLRTQRKKQGFRLWHHLIRELTHG